MLAVAITLTAVPGQEDALIAALENNAAHSRHEADCLRWEWSRHLEDPARFFIYEVYTSQEAFLTHKASDHFAAWKQESEGTIATKEATQYEITDPDSRA